MMQGILRMSTMMYAEVYGNRIHAFHLLDCHNHTVNLQLNREMTKLKAKRNAECTRSEHLEQLQITYALFVVLVDKDGNPDLKK